MTRDNKPLKRNDVPETNLSRVTAMIAGQQEHWEATLTANPAMYGTEPSEAGNYAIERFVAEGYGRIIELGAGQGRDTLGFLRSGLEVHALDYVPDALSEIMATAGPMLSEGLTTTVHDVRYPLPFADGSFDACYSHMLFTMALTTIELGHLAEEIRRVLRPGGLCIYTVRHIGDPHFGAGGALGDNLYENGGFVVHFFDRPLVDRLAAGFEIENVKEFEEGSLPRKLWRVTKRKI